MEKKKTANKDLKKPKNKTDIIKRNIEAAKAPRNKSKENQRPVQEKKPVRARSEKNLKKKEIKVTEETGKEIADPLGIKSPVSLKNSPEKAEKISLEKEEMNKIASFEILTEGLVTEVNVDLGTEDGNEGKTPVRVEEKIMTKASSHKRRRDSSEDIEGFEKAIKYSQ